MQNTYSIHIHLYICRTFVWTLQLTFIKVAVNGYVVLMALDEMQLQSIDDVPEDLPADSDTLVKYFERIAVKILDTIMSKPTLEDMKLIAEGYKSGPHDEDAPFVYCFCKEGSY